jgi:hypothetical protein
MGNVVAHNKENDTSAKITNRYRIFMYGTVSAD